MDCGILLSFFENGRRSLCFFVDCGRLLGKLRSELRLPVLIAKHREDDVLIPRDKTSDHNSSTCGKISVKQQ
jgi:hypothetical protein